MISCLAYSSTVKMEATCSSQTSADIQRTTPRYIPEDRTIEDELFVKRGMLPQLHDNLVFIHLEIFTFYLLLKAINVKDTHVR
jgi:hypothetical protein